MNLKNIDDNTLILKVEALAKEERELLTKVLHHLKEIERRRLFAELGYRSLHDFATRHLGYSDDQAYRRIAAMRLLKEIPEIEEKIASGELSLSHISLAQSLFNQEKKYAGKLFTKEEKQEVFEKISTKPIREAERITVSMASHQVPSKPDQIRIITEEKVELKFQASKSLQDKIEKLKGLLAHKNPDMPLGELFEKLCDMGIEQLGPGKRAEEKVATSRKHRSVNPTSKAEVRRDVFREAEGKCQNCGSTYALEVDHIQPKAKGGLDVKENLRILCRTCNQRAAVKEFGVGKMEVYL